MSINYCKLSKLLENHPGITIHTQTQMTKLHGTDALECVTIRDNTFELSEAFEQTMLSKEHKVRLANCGDGVRDGQERIME